MYIHMCQNCIGICNFVTTRAILYDIVISGECLKAMEMTLCTRSVATLKEVNIEQQFPISKYIRVDRKAQYGTM